MSSKSRSKAVVGICSDFLPLDHYMKEKKLSILFYF